MPVQSDKIFGPKVIMKLSVDEDYFFWIFWILFLDVGTTVNHNSSVWKTFFAERAIRFRKPKNYEYVPKQETIATFQFPKTSRIFNSQKMVPQIYRPRKIEKEIT